MSGFPPTLTPTQIDALQESLSDVERLDRLEALVNALIAENAALYRLAQLADHKVGCPARAGAYRPGRCRCSFVRCELDARAAVAQSAGREREARLATASKPTDASAVIDMSDLLTRGRR